MKQFIAALLFSSVLISCSTPEEDEKSGKNELTYMKTAEIVGDSDGIRQYTYDANYNLTKIQTDTKTFTFEYYPINSDGKYKLQSIELNAPGLTKIIRPSYGNVTFLDEINSLEIITNGASVSYSAERDTDFSDALKVDFGGSSITFVSNSINSDIKRISTKHTDGSSTEIYFTFDEFWYGTFYQYPDNLWLMYLVDYSEYMKIPLTNFGIDNISILEVPVSGTPLQTMNRNFTNTYLNKLKSSEVLEGEEPIYTINYTFGDLPPKVE